MKVMHACMDVGYVPVPTKIISTNKRNRNRTIDATQLKRNATQRTNKFKRTKFCESRIEWLDGINKLQGRKREEGKEEGKRGKEKLRMHHHHHASINQ